MYYNKKPFCFVSCAEAGDFFGQLSFYIPPRHPVRRTNCVPGFWVSLVVTDSVGSLPDIGAPKRCGEQFAARGFVPLACLP